MTLTELLRLIIIDHLVLRFEKDKKHMCLKYLPTGQGNNAKFIDLSLILIMDWFGRHSNSNGFLIEKLPLSKFAAKAS